MDFDTIVNLIILFLFLALPSLLKRIKTKKSRPGQPAQKGAGKKNKPVLFALFGKITSQIEQFRMELERQARLQQQSEKTAWDDLAEPLPEDPGQEPDFPEQGFRADPWDPGEKDADFLAAEAMEPEKPKMRREPEPVRKKGPSSETCPRPLRRAAPCRLRKAVIWSEILGKPVALRSGDGSFRN